MTHTYRAYAKINLLLSITGKLPNGYHSVAMINQSIGLYDTITVEQTVQPGIVITCNVPGIPTNKRNIVHKACQAFGIVDGLHIHIEKRIPSEAGLAGGSANAAAVLTALRDIHVPGMPDEQLHKIAVTVGADVPFCLVGGCCFAQGVGEVLTPLPCLPKDYSIALVKPDFGVSTAAAYATLDQMDLARPQTELALSHAKQSNWPEVFPLCANVFEQAVDFPGLVLAKQQALQHGAALVQMTGSGSAVFAVFRAQDTTENISQTLGVLGEFVGIFRPVLFGVEKITLPL